MTDQNDPYDIFIYDEGDDLAIEEKKPERPQLKLVKCAQIPQDVRRALRWQTSIRQEGLTAARSFVRLCYKLYWFKEMEMYRTLDSAASFDSWLQQPENGIGRSTGHLAVQAFGLFVRDLLIPLNYLHGVDKTNVRLANGQVFPVHMRHKPAFGGARLVIGQKKFALITPMVERMFKDERPKPEIRRKALDLLWQATHESEADLKAETDSEWETLFNGSVPLSLLTGFSSVRDVLSFIGALGHDSVVITVRRKRT